MEKHRSTSNGQSVFKAYQETKGFLKKYLRRFYNSPQDIEDALQESFLKTFEIEKRQAIEDPQAYLFMTVSNFAKRDLKKKAHLSAETIEEISETNLSLGMRAVERNLEARQDLALFCEAANSLPEQCRKAFLLRKIYGYSQKEIAKTMEISVSTVEKHLAKGLMRSVEYMNKKGAAVEKRTSDNTSAAKSNVTTKSPKA